MRLVEWKKFHDSLIQFNIPFKCLKTSMTIKINSVYGDDEFIDRNKNSLPLGEMWFIKKVKDYCLGLNLVFNTDREKIKYIHMPRFKRAQVFTNLMEVDLNSAYWNFAFREKIISEEIYKIGTEGYINPKGERKFISKKTRLAALGALAKNTFCWSFTGTEWKSDGVIQAEKADYFFRCCELTGEIMNDLRFICENDFLLFWVDAIFFKENSLKDVTQYLEIKDLEFKQYKIDAVVFEFDRLIVYSQERYYIEKDEPRTFFLKKDNFDILNNRFKPLEK